MARDFFSGLGSGISRLAKDLSNLIPEQSETQKLDAEIAGLESDIASIEEETRVCYERIGRQAVSESGLERFGEDGETLAGYLSQIEEKKREIERIQSEQAAAQAAQPEVTETADGVRCPGCGAENAPGAKFCCECGQKLAPPVCPNCGAQVKPGVKFCGECGQKLEG